MDLAGKGVVVIGLGKSGVSAARLCLARGATVTAADAKPREQLAKAAAELEQAGVRLELGNADGMAFLSKSRADLIVVSPGVPSSEPLEQAEARGTPVVAEVELASRFLQGAIVGVTGTNGKSTVTSLIGEMMLHHGFATFVGGNLGTPLCDAVGTPAAGPDGRIVVELSSFQLERIEHLRPQVAVLLNVTEDHLDRYPSMAAYGAAKRRIFGAQTGQDHSVVDGEDEVALDLARGASSMVHTFGGNEGEVRERAGMLVDHGAPRGPVSYPISQLRLDGAHNHRNAAAAILAARLAGASSDAIGRGLREFRGLPHRMELVADHGGVQFFNDSKATNVGAAVAALRGFEGSVVLIAGGRDKGGDYEPLRREAEGRARALVLVGEAADVIEGAMKGTVPTVRAKDMDDAVALAAARACSGDAVLLAPACSSFDMFSSYIERGERFREAVTKVSHGGARDPAPEAAGSSTAVEGRGDSGRG